jgi:hypothetical protein
MKKYRGIDIQKTRGISREKEEKKEREEINKVGVFAES